MVPKQVSETIFSTSDGAEILTAASSYIQLSAVKISGSSYVEKVVFETIFGKGNLKNRGKTRFLTFRARWVTF